jgi:hypothetical protein
MRSGVVHAPRVARWADGAPSTGERDQPIVTAVVAAHPGEAVREDAAVEVARELSLDERGEAVTVKIFCASPSEEGLEVILYG